MSELYGLLAGLIILLGAPFYFIDILRRKTRPERTTWFLWSLLSVIAFFSQLSLGARWSLVYIGLEGVGNIAVFGLSIRYGIGGWFWPDKVALAIACIGLSISFAVHAPTVAILGVVAADLAAMMLTIEKAYFLPTSETVVTWLSLAIAATLTTLSVGTWNFGLLVYPAYLAITCSILLIVQLLMARKRHVILTLS